MVGGIKRDGVIGLVNKRRSIRSMKKEMDEDECRNLNTPPSTSSDEDEHQNTTETGADNEKLWTKTTQNLAIKISYHITLACIMLFLILILILLMQRICPPIMVLILIMIMIFRDKISTLLAKYLIKCGTFGLERGLLS